MQQSTLTSNWALRVCVCVCVCVCMHQTYDLGDFELYVEFNFIIS